MNKKLVVFGLIIAVGLMAGAIFTQAKLVTSKATDPGKLSVAITEDSISDLVSEAKSMTDLVCGEPVLDSDGNSYSTVTVKSQCWMGENLRTKTKPNGTCINGGGNPPCADASVADNGQGRACYGNNEANCKSNGALYKWTAAMNGSITEGAQGICPKNWHVPSDSELAFLEQYLTDDGQPCDPNRNQFNPNQCATAGAKLAIGGSSGLDFPFAGVRTNAFTFMYAGGSSYIMSSSTSVSPAGTYARELNTGSDKVGRYVFGGQAISLRCIKNS